MIISPKGTKILVDGGEVEQNILIPYLLARKIKTLDYVFISHFDSDHCGGVKEVLEALNVKNLVVARQLEQSNECDEIMKIAKQKKTKIIFAQAGQKIRVSKDINFDIIWPCNDSLIAENAMNNNSLVVRLNYRNFKMLFTGDIEQIAEEKIVEKYGGKLKSTILKVAHHGSKTSSIEEFIEAVKPQIALIGVRKR